MLRRGRPLARQGARRPWVVRALRPVPPGAVRGRPPTRGSARSPSWPAASAPARGCAVCKPAVASMFASLAVGLRARRRAGVACRTPTTTSSPTSSATPAPTRSCPGRPAGEITPEGLIAIGEVARDFDLYTKITGGQRIDLFGATRRPAPAHLGPADRRRLRVGPRVRQGRPHREVVHRVHLVPVRRAGLRPARHRPRGPLPGAAGPAQDQAGRVRLRPRVRRGAGQGRGRDRHRAGGGTSTSAATAGCGPGTPTCWPRTSTPSRSPRAIDRFLMYYVRTADRLERTATWLEKLEAGLDHARQAVLEDSLGIGADLDADMATRRGGPTSASGRPPWRTPSAWPGSRSFTNTDEQGSRPHLRACAGPEAARMSTASVSVSRLRLRLGLDRRRPCCRCAHPHRGTRRDGGGTPGGRVPQPDGSPPRHRQPPTRYSAGQRPEPRHRRLLGRRAGRRVCSPSSSSASSWPTGRCIDSPEHSVAPHPRRVDHRRPGPRAHPPR